MKDEKISRHIVKGTFQSVLAILTNTSSVSMLFCVVSLDEQRLPNQPDVSGRFRQPYNSADSAWN